jgi:iron-sulfur cluster assembly protein
MISLTPLAAEKVRYHLDRRGQGLGVKVGVRTTGCSGLAYFLEYVDIEPSKQDNVLYESNGIKIWVDPKSLPYINGMEMDWIKQGLNEGFDFVNPNEKDRCGCGESFRV